MSRLALHDPLLPRRTEGGPPPGLPALTHDAKATLCGYAWGDVCSALSKAVAAGDMGRAQRWAAELVCSETGLSRLEAALLEAWATQVGGGAPGWPRRWLRTLVVLRDSWEGSGGDVRAVRNTPHVRNAVAAAVAYATAGAKAPLPTLPAPALCFAEAPALRERLRLHPPMDQMGTRAVWVPGGADGADLRVLGNELEGAVRAGQTAPALFWLVWLLTLDVQKDRPNCRERGPTNLPAKTRGSFAWYVAAVLEATLAPLAPPAAGGGHRTGVPAAADALDALELLPLTWARLGARGRRSVLAAATVLACSAFRATGGGGAPAMAPALTQVAEGAVASIDAVYGRIAEEARTVPPTAATLSVAPAPPSLLGGAVRYTTPLSALDALIIRPQG